MKNSTKFYFLWLLVLLLLSGCFGGSSQTPKYDLEITVMDEDSNPIIGAVVEIANGVTDSKTTESSGKVTFSNLTNNVDIVVTAAGYQQSFESITMNKHQNVTIIMQASNSLVVTTGSELSAAIADSEISMIELGADITANVQINRLVDFSLNNFTFTGDITYSFEEAGELTLSGTGQLAGDLTVDAAAATVTNYMQVAGEIIIEAVAANTWNEEGDGNNIVINADNVVININAETDTITIVGQGNTVNVTSTLNRIIANSPLQIVGGNHIEIAEINADDVEFDYPPQAVDETSDHNPIIIVPFVPGSGDPIPQLSPTSEPGIVGALILRATDRELFLLNDATRPVVEFRFSTPEELEATGYTLEYSADQGSNWDTFLYNDSIVETNSPDQDNFVLNPGADYWFRLRINGGPLDGYVSNAVEAPLSSVKTYFSGWGLDQGMWLTGVMCPYVGYGLEAGASAKALESPYEEVSEYINYQWYRVNPFTYEMTEIAGATDNEYVTTIDDAGYLLLFKAYGDNENVGGYLQVMTGECVVIPNRGHINNVTDTGFTLYLEKSVPSLDAEDLEISYWETAGLVYIDVISVTEIENNAIFQIEADLSDVDTMAVRNKSYHWHIVSSHGDSHHYGEGIYYDPDNN